MKNGAYIAIILISFMCVVFAVTVFWIAPRALDRYFWPLTGWVRAAYGIKSPTVAQSLGRDCFLRDDENLWRKLPDTYIAELLATCSERQEIVQKVERTESPEFVKLVARCQYENRILERSVVEFRGDSEVPDVCTVSLFDKENDPGIGGMTISDYE